MNEPAPLEKPSFTLDRYLDYTGHKTLAQSDNRLVVQLKNLKVIEVLETSPATYQISEITVGANLHDRYTSHLDLNELIEEIIKLADSRDIYFVTWTVDDVLALNKGLNRNHAQLALHAAFANHDPNIGINLQVISNQCDNVINMIRSGII